MPHFQCVDFEINRLIANVIESFYTLNRIIRYILYNEASYIYKVTAYKFPVIRAYPRKCYPYRIFLFRNMYSFTASWIEKLTRYRDWLCSDRMIFHPLNDAYLSFTRQLLIYEPGDPN